MELLAKKRIDLREVDAEAIMIPLLYSSSGPLKGSSTTLNEEELSIGRDRSNHMAIPDLQLSRRHCVIRRHGDEYRIVDLGSRNGVFVNSIPTRERTLNHGDQIAIGSSVFLFLSKEDNDAIETILSDGAFSGGSFLTTKWDQKPESPRDVKDFDILLKINSAIGGIQNTDSLCRKLLDLLMEFLPAERGAILLADNTSDALTMVARLSQSGDLPPARINRNLTDRVLKEKLAFLGRDVQQEENRIPSLICVPVVFAGDVLGILYADALDPVKELHEKHLEFVNAIANISAPVIRNCLDMEKWIERSKQLQTELRMNRRIVGESVAIRKVLELMKKISGADTTVLITGESGTGKELAARGIHENSRRADHPFIAINCAALPDTLLESELFGHEKGAFTGAVAQKKGKLELANQGTLFLDEIAELALPLQAKLLRFLQEREFERLGGTKTIRVDLRLIAATNKSLEKEIAKGTFRNDLYYRLNVVQLEMPALRELDDDIALLANYFVSTLSRKIGRQIHGISPEAQQCLMLYDWPGNIRELENVLERAVLLGSTDLILPDDLPDSILAFRQPVKEGSADFHEAVNEYKKKLIRKALEASDQDYNSAAASLGIHPAHLYRLVRSLKIT